MVYFKQNYIFSGTLDPRMRMIDPLASSERQVFSCNGTFSIVTLQNMIRYMVHTYRDFI